MMYCFECRKHYPFNYWEEYQDHYLSLHPEQLPEDFVRDQHTPQERVERRLSAYIIR